MIWKAFQAMLFKMDPEDAHERVLSLLSGKFPGREAVLGMLPRSKSFPTTINGVEFLNPLGLAAGFDKNAEILEVLSHLGFGFAEIGTVTPLPQVGNPKPRLFRYRDSKSLFNAMGFNGDGASAVARRLESARSRLPETFRVGVNIGKNAVTPLEDAASDYEKAIRPFRGIVDYAVINVSSPNTPGLRSLQTPENLVPLVSAVRNELVRWPKSPPVFVKIAPELTGKDLEKLIPAAERAGVQGWIATNTLADERPGGWSGRKLTLVSRARLVELRGMTKQPVISVGGIDSSEEALERMKLGANLIQIYSAWIFEGPRLPFQIVDLISKLGEKQPK